MECGVCAEELQDYDGSLRWMDGQRSERVNGDTNGEPLAHAAQGGMEGDGWMSDVEEG